MTQNFVSCDILPMFSTEHATDVLTTIIGCMYCGIVIAKTEGNFLVWNDKAAEVLGKKEEKIDYKDWPKYYGCYNPKTEELLEYTDLPLYKSMNGEYVSNYLILIKNKTTPKSWINCNSKPLFHNGKITGGVIVFQDVTKEIMFKEKIKAFSENLKALGEHQESIIQNWS